MDLIELAWPQVSALSKDMPVFIPIAALEQHGHHLPLFTDSLLLGEVVRRMKPEEIEKSKVDAEEAYFYLGYYYYAQEKNLPMAKCWMEKVRDLNAGTNNTKIGSDMILTKEMKDLAPADCTLLP